MRTNRISHNNDNSHQVVASPQKRTLTEKETAIYISVSRSTLRKARMNGHIKNHIVMPPYLKFGRSIRYLIDDLDAWLVGRRIGGLSAEGGRHV